MTHRCQHPERDAGIIEARLGGATIATVAEGFGLSAARVCVILAAHGVKVDNRRGRASEKFQVRPKSGVTRSPTVARERPL